MKETFVGLHPDVLPGAEKLHPDPADAHCLLVFKKIRLLCLQDPALIAFLDLGEGQGLHAGRSFLGKRSQRRVPVKTCEEVLRLYQERYFDLSVHHFHENLREKHSIKLSYTWVKQA